MAQALQEDRVVSCGLIVTEILRGARNSKEQKILREHFQILESISMEEWDYFDAASMGFELARKGITVKTIDLLIARLALKHHLRLLHQDGDFELIAKYFSLKTQFER